MYKVNEIPMTPLKTWAFSGLLPKEINFTCFYMWKSKLFKGHKYHVIFWPDAKSQTY